MRRWRYADLIPIAISNLSNHLETRSPKEVRLFTDKRSLFPAICRFPKVHGLRKISETPCTGLAVRNSVALAHGIVVCDSRGLVPQHGNEHFLHHGLALDIRGGGGGGHKWR
jgi:hypothetical protein